MDSKSTSPIGSTVNRMLDYIHQVYDASKFRTFTEVTPSNQSFNGKCKCTIEFENFEKERSKIEQQINSNESLQRPYRSVVLSQLKSLSKGPNPNYYENTYIVHNDEHCLLQLKNKTRLEELEKMDKDLESTSEHKKIPHWWDCKRMNPETKTRLFASGEAPRELCWDFRIVEQIKNRVVYVAETSNTKTS